MALDAVFNRNRSLAYCAAESRHALLVIGFIWNCIFIIECCSFGHFLATRSNQDRVYRLADETLESIYVLGVAVGECVVAGFFS